MCHKYTSLEEELKAHEEWKRSNTYKTRMQYAQRAKEKFPLGAHVFFRAGDFKSDGYVFYHNDEKGFIHIGLTRTATHPMNADTRVVGYDVCAGWMRADSVIKPL